MPSSQCSPPTARPGTSMHELGLAIDFSCNGTLIRNRASACHQWLADHAASYGLHPLVCEPWHWSSNGRLLCSRLSAPRLLGELANSVAQRPSLG
jgi:hypothetical protein